MLRVDVTAAGTLSHTSSAQAAASTPRCPQEAGHPSCAELSLAVPCSCPSAGGKEEGQTGFRDFPGFPVPGIYFFLIGPAADSYLASLESERDFVSNAEK